MCSRINQTVTWENSFTALHMVYPVARKHIHGA